MCDRVEDRGQVAIVEQIAAPQGHLQPHVEGIGQRGVEIVDLATKRARRGERAGKVALAAHHIDEPKEPGVDLYRRLIREIAAQDYAIAGVVDLLLDLRPEHRGEFRNPRHFLARQISQRRRDEAHIVGVQIGHRHVECEPVGRADHAVELDAESLAHTRVRQDE